jgi:hypothetical protein
VAERSTQKRFPKAEQMPPCNKDEIYFPRRLICNFPTMECPDCLLARDLPETISVNEKRDKCESKQTEEKTRERKKNDSNEK